MREGGRLRTGTKLAFGIGAASEGAQYIAFNTWNFLFYNQVLGLSGTLAGLAVTISLLLDGISEPVIGSLSDRWKSKLGRRHPFLYAAPIPLALSFFLLYVPPAGLSALGLFLWFTVFATIQRQAITFYQVPHLALGAELSTDYHERTIVMSYTALFGVLGGAATFFFGWTWFSHVPGGIGVRDGYPVLGLGVGLISALLIFVSAHFTRDQIPYLVQPKTDAPRLTLRQLYVEVGDCLKNRNYVMLLLGLFSLSATLGVRETLSPYANLFFWELPENKIRLFGAVTPPAFIIAFFLTLRLHRRFDKRRTIVGAASAIAIFSALPIPLRLLGLLPENGQPGLMSVLLLFMFLFYGGVAVLTISVLSALADVADEHELDTGRRQEGVFYAARTFFSKLSSALGHILGGFAIDLIAFPKGAKPGQVAADTVLQLGVIEGPVSALPAFLAIAFYGAYKINRARHAEIQRALAARRGVSPDALEGQRPPAAASVEPAPI